MKSAFRIKNPIFFEIHRLSQFSKRGTEVSVILDLMIHDIDIVLSAISQDYNAIRCADSRLKKSS